MKCDENKILKAQQECLEGKSAIYTIKCNECQLLYVGSTNNVKKRFYKHNSELANLKHGNRKLNTCAEKCSSDRILLFEVIQIVEVIDRYVVESAILKKYRALKKYNVANAVDPLIHIFSQISISKESRERITQHSKNRMRKQSKLSEIEVRKIKESFRDGLTINELIETFSATRNVIWHILKENTWKDIHVEGFEPFEDTITDKEVVYEIKKMIVNGYGIKEIARKLNITEPVIAAIRRGDRHADVYCEGFKPNQYTLTEEQVVKIKEMTVLGKSAKQIVDVLGISLNQCRDVRKGSTFNEVFVEGFVPIVKKSPRRFTDEEKRKILKDLSNGKSLSEIGREYNASAGTISTMIKRFREKSEEL